MYCGNEIFVEQTKVWLMESYKNKNFVFTQWLNIFSCNILLLKYDNMQYGSISD